MRVSKKKDYSKPAQTPKQVKIKTSSVCIRAKGIGPEKSNKYVHMSSKTIQQGGHQLQQAQGTTCLGKTPPAGKPVWGRHLADKNRAENHPAKVSHTHIPTKGNATRSAKSPRQHI